MTSKTVYSVDDLADWRSEGTCLAVLGHPVAHSVSPAMHHAALARLAIDEPAFATWRYFKFDVTPELLGFALPRFHAAGFLGLNLTIPHKVLAISMIERVEAGAAEAGAVNTLRRTTTGFEGFNTDGHGIIHAVRAALDTEIRCSDVILLGAGGAARAAAVACLRAGCASLAIGNRSARNLETLLEALAPVAARRGVQLQGFPLERPPPALPPDALVINATASGLKPDDLPPIDLRRVPGRPRVYDMIYNPPETPLLRQARALGCPAANGLSMLAHQGAKALELWTGRPVDAEPMFHACQNALPSR